MTESGSTPQSMVSCAEIDIPQWALDGLALRWREPAALGLSTNGDVTDWQPIATTLARHRVAGPLHRQAQLHPEYFPEELARRLWFVRCLISLRCEHWQEQTSQMLSALAEVGVTALVLKGWALVGTVYEGDLTLRQTVDVDLLVPKADVRRADTVLGGLRYKALSSDPWPGFSQRYHHAQMYGQPGGDGTALLVGLHWRLLDIPYFERIPMSDWFARAKPACVAGVSALVPAPEDHIVYLCGHHALHHRYEFELFRYHDLAALIHDAGGELDWDAVLKRAADWRLLIPLQRTLMQLRELWPEIVPEPVVQRLTGMQPTRGERWVHDWTVDQPRSPTRHTVLSLATMPGLGRKVRYLLEVGFPCRTYMQRRYGPAPGGFWPLLTLRRVAAAARYAIPCRPGSRT